MTIGTGQADETVSSSQGESSRQLHDGSSQEPVNSCNVVSEAKPTCCYCDQPHHFCTCRVMESTVTFQDSGICQPLSRLSSRPLGVRWMWIASFTSSSIFFEAVSMISTASQSTRWPALQECSATADFSGQ